MLTEWMVLAFGLKVLEMEESEICCQILVTFVLMLLNDPPSIEISQHSMMVLKTMKFSYHQHDKVALGADRSVKAVVAFSAVMVLGLIVVMERAPAAMISV